jgi:hypothetical protein
MLASARLRIDRDTRDRALQLLGPAREEAFDAGDAPLLLRALEGTPTAPVSAERAAAYLNVLYALVLLRRGHDLEPLHEDLYRRVERPYAATGEDYPSELFAQDLAQLAEWGCVQRITEPLRIRGYRDNRREQYRYRLGDDALALIEWLEERLWARLKGRSPDGRDLLSDVLAHLKEAQKLLERWREGERDGDLARRAVYVVVSMDETVLRITRELLSFRAGMLAFASRPYQLDSLRQILGWLERYVTVYLKGVEKLRGEIEERLLALAQPRFRRALAECETQLAEERTALPSTLKGSALRRAEESIDTQGPFFAAAGQLARLCENIDGSARAVLKKMHRHLRELERRSARVAELRAAVDRLSRLNGEEQPELARFCGRIIGSAHARFDGRAEPDGRRALPPLPRSHKTAATTQVSRPLRLKQETPESARELRARRDALLAEWLSFRLGSRRSVRLSQLALSDSSAPRAWLDVARARHLQGGSTLERMRFRIADVAKTVTTVGGDRVGLVAADCIIDKVEEA